MAQGISKITVKGFKSLYDETSVEIRPLTILAGANSSGKSSIMQPLLLMKQTLESTYTPRVFLLNGLNVRYTDPRQFFLIDSPESELEVSLGVDNVGDIVSSYSIGDHKSIKIEKTKFIRSHNYIAPNYAPKRPDVFILSRGMQHNDIAQQIPDEMELFKKDIEEIANNRGVFYGVGVYFYFLNISMLHENGSTAINTNPFEWEFYPIRKFNQFIQDIIHVPGLRDNPERSYPIAQIQGNFVGTFDNYFASVINEWTEQEWKNNSPIIRLVRNMKDLRLSSGLKTHIQNNEISIEVPHPRSKSGVNIADVGLGVSQVLPVLVALLVAKEGQLVYLEQPELHLHPRAQ
ncbi:MAG: AAA family ATPase, partial [Chloroflexota bacterium]